MKVLLATQKPFAAKAVEGIVSILEAGGHEVVKLEKYAAQEDFVKAVATPDRLPAVTLEDSLESHRICFLAG